MFENYQGIENNYQYLHPTQYHKIDNKTNADSPINCESPSIIFNPRWYEYLYKCDDVVLDGEMLDRVNFVARSQSQIEKYIWSNYQVTMDNYKHFVLIGSKIDVVPLFYLVPCGHCHCCTTSKSDEYAFRSVCETAVHDEVPLFITLTYRPGEVPKNGVEVDDLQRFFKRLRFHLKNNGYDSNIRYLATSEYGEKSGRPHYHVLLWNYPTSRFSSVNHAYRLIYKSWKRYMLFNGKRKYHYNSKTKKRTPAMRVLGLIKILPVTKGCTGYITKYFRKEDHNKLNYRNKTFLLSSRRNGGIGSHYIMQFRDKIYNDRCCDDLNISVFNKLTQSRDSRSVSGYLKNILFKSRSAILPKKQYEIISRVKLLWHDLHAIMYVKNVDRFDSLFNFKVIGERLSHWIEKYPRLYYIINYKYFFRLTRKELKRQFHEKLQELLSLYFAIDFSILDLACRRLDEREEFLRCRSKIERQLHINMIARYDKYCRNYHNYKLKCTF